MKKIYTTPDSIIIEMAVMCPLMVSPNGAQVTDTPQGINLDNVQGDNGNAYNDAASNSAIWDD